MARLTGAERYDVVYREHHATIEPHFCREWDDEGGCYGTNPNHGFTFEAACEVVAGWYAEQAALWRSGEHHECLSYQPAGRAALAEKEG